MRKIIHKYILAKSLGKGLWGGYLYLCNWAVEANWKKTDITNKRVTCKNCLRAIKKFKKEHSTMMRLEHIKVLGLSEAKRK